MAKILPRHLVAGILSVILSVAVVVMLESGGAQAGSSAQAEPAIAIPAQDQTSVEPPQPTLPLPPLAPPPAVEPQGDELSKPTTRPYTDKVVVLMYHHLDPNPEGDSTMTPDAFRAQMQFLSEDGFSVISLAQLEAFLLGTEPVPPKAVVITFDDGYESVYKYAFPILREFGFPSASFIIVSSVGIIPPGGVIPHMSWDEMREMQASGLATFGSHTYDLHRYVSVPGDARTRPAVASRLTFPWMDAAETDAEYKARIGFDLLLSKQLMEQSIGVPVNAIAFPYGISSGLATIVARSIGFEWMFGVNPGAVKPGDVLGALPRVNAGSPRITVARLAESIEKAVCKASEPAPSPAPTPTPASESAPTTEPAPDPSPDPAPDPDPE